MCGHKRARSGGLSGSDAYTNAPRRGESASIELAPADDHIGVVVHWQGNDDRACFATVAEKVKN
jgi:hypothetical protein